MKAAKNRVAEAEIKGVEGAVLLSYMLWHKFLTKS